MTVGRVPSAPAELSAAGAAEWARVVGHVMTLGAHPAGLDAAIFALYCHAVGQLVDVRQAWLIEGAPIYVIRPAGPRAHPALGLMRQLGADVARLAHQLGMTPRSRKVLALDLGALPLPPAPDALDDLATATDRAIANRYFGGH